MRHAEQLPPDQWPIGDPPADPYVPPSRPDEDDEDDDENDFGGACARR